MMTNKFGQSASGSAVKLVKSLCPYPNYVLIMKTTKTFDQQFQEKGHRSHFVIEIGKIAT